MRSKAGREGTAPVNENGISVVLAVAVVVVAVVSSCAEPLDDNDDDDGGEKVVLRPRLGLGPGAFCTMAPPSIFLDALVNRSNTSSSSSSSKPLRLFSLGRMRPAAEVIMPGVGVSGRDRARASASRRLSSSSSSSLGRLGGGPPEGEEIETCLWKSFGLDGGPSVDIGRAEERRDGDDGDIWDEEDASRAASSFSSSA